jgi:hypothetical protein
MQAPGSNLLKITRAVCNVKGDPAYDERTKAAYDRVQRAYNKAVSMIEEVGNYRSKALSQEQTNLIQSKILSSVKQISKEVESMHAQSLEDKE